MKGRYGIHGGQYIPETLMSEIHKIEDELISGMEQTEQDEVKQKEVAQVEPLEKDNGNEDLGASI